MRRSYEHYALAGGSGISKWTGLRKVYRPWFGKRLNGPCTSFQLLTANNWAVRNYRSLNCRNSSILSRDFRGEGRVVILIGIFPREIIGGNFLDDKSVSGCRQLLRTIVDAFIIRETNSTFQLLPSTAAAQFPGRPSPLIRFHRYRTR
jgi:hypothetical protein